MTSLQVGQLPPLLHFTFLTYEVTIFANKDRATSRNFEANRTLHTFPKSTYIFVECPIQLLVLGDLNLVLQHGVASHSCQGDGCLADLAQSFYTISKVITEFTVLLTRNWNSQWSGTLL